MKRFFKDLNLKYNQSELRALYVLVVLFVVLLVFRVLVFPLCYSDPFQDLKITYPPIIEQKSFSVNKMDVSKNRVTRQLIDINKASESQLKQIKGVGRVLSKRIVVYREKIGGFNSVEDLLNVYGVKKELIENNKGNIFCSHKQSVNTQNTLPVLKNGESKNKEKRTPIDINKASEFELRELIGIGKVLSKRIIVYRNKIGGFNSVGDLQKVYGVNKELIIYNKGYLICTKNKEKIRLKIDLNQINKKQLMKFDGIGLKLADRVLSFRDKLGGFYHVNQLYEVYFLDSLVVDKIKGNLFVSYELIRKISLEEASFVKLIKHPYIDKKLTNDILKYLSGKDSTQTIEDMYKNNVLDSVDYLRLRNYFKN